MSFKLPKQFRKWCEVAKLAPIISCKKKSKWYALEDTYGGCYILNYYNDSLISVNKSTPLPNRLKVELTEQEKSDRTLHIKMTAQTGYSLMLKLPDNEAEFVSLINQLNILSII